MLEKTLESPLDCKEIQPFHPKGNQSWILIGRTDVEAKALILWSSDVKNCLIWKDPDAGKDWGQGEKGMTEDELLDGITEWMDIGLCELRELVMHRQAWHAAVDGVAESPRGLSHWTEWLTGLVIFPTHFNLSLNLTVRNSWSEPQCSWSYFCWLYRAFPYLRVTSYFFCLSILGT